MPFDPWAALGHNPWKLETSDYNTKIAAYIYNQREMYGMSDPHELETEASCAYSFLVDRAIRCQVVLEPNLLDYEILMTSGFPK